jgi:hypothetical protein
MHAVMIQVKVDGSREQEARQLLQDVVVPTAKALAGFAGGTWCRALEGDAGRSVLLFDSEENAKAAAEEIRSQGPPAGAPVTMEAVDAYEVVAQA